MHKTLCFGIQKTRKLSDILRFNHLIVKTGIKKSKK